MILLMLVSIAMQMDTRINARISTIQIPSIHSHSPDKVNFAISSTDPLVLPE